MSSSTSSSERPDPGAAWTPWRAWIRSFCITAAAGLVTLYAGVVMVDPFSTGRFAIFDDVDVAISDGVLANAGRVRDGRFDAAVIGNSHAARFRPATLDAVSGRHFVQLSVLGLGPTEELIMARAFVAHHRSQGVALVLGIDQFWCRAEEEGVLVSPDFPRWLYQSTRLEYLRNILMPEAVQATVHRLAIRLLGAPPPSRADGYFEREPTAPAWVMARVVAEPRPVEARPVGTPFPELDRLETLVATMDAQTRLVLLMPPYYVSHIPMPGSDAAARLEACKTRLAAIARTLPHGVVVDYMRADDVTENSSNFIDATHARDHVIRALETDIGAVLRGDAQAGMAGSRAN